MRESRRYLGLELAGAKNQKTALATLEYYPKESKIFLLDIYDRVPNDNKSGDEALLDLINDFRPGVARMGINVPLELPPCTDCSRKTCPLPSKCTVPSVKWMRTLTRRISRGPDKHSVREFTPYTQRPIELWLRYEILSMLPESHRFEIDETLGGNKAPLTARMGFLKRHLSELSLVEVVPKLSVAILAMDLGLNKRTISTYRRLEEGIHARETILDALVERHDVFVYERDIRSLAHSLPAFDAFICAYTALLSDLDRCAKSPTGFPASTGWIHYPEMSRS